MTDHVALVGTAVVVPGEVAVRLAKPLREFVQSELRREGGTVNPGIAELLMLLDQAKRRTEEQRALAQQLISVRAELGSQPTPKSVHPPERDGVSAREAGRLLDVTPHRVRQLHSAGELHALTLRRPMQFDRDEVLAMAAERKRTA